MIHSINAYMYSVEYHFMICVFIAANRPRDERYRIYKQKVTSCSVAAAAAARHLQTDQSVVFPHYHTCIPPTPHPPHPPTMPSTLLWNFPHSPVVLSATHKNTPSTDAAHPPPTPTSCSLNLVYLSFFSLYTT